MGKKQKIQADIRESVQKIWLAGLGAFAVAEEEGSKVFKNLVEKGQDFESKGRDSIDKVRDRVDDTRDKFQDLWTRIESTINENVTTTLGRMGIPSKEEIANLTQRVEELTKSIEAVKKQKAPTPRKTTTRRTAAKPAVKKTKAAE